MPYSLTASELSTENRLQGNSLSLSPAMAHTELNFMPAKTTNVADVHCGTGTLKQVGFLESTFSKVRIIPGDTPEKAVARDAETFEEEYGGINFNDEVEWEEYEYTPQELTEKRKYDMAVLKKRKGTGYLIN